ncbi:hypothetical protein PIB30_089344 [Stylosanthes scabra]|uniref:Uncharacterized protein n=1 Tax=Stylosanthes scabra TaxID=79078 RepID=A0ABU6QUF0_9FABA|nr:hypothetical protein [Stylosanthes scabra]
MGRRISTNVSGTDAIQIKILTQQAELTWIIAIAIKEYMKERVLTRLSEAWRAKEKCRLQMRDKSKMKRTISNKGREIIQRSALATPYIVDFLEDDEEMHEPKPAAAMEGALEFELAQEISHDLQIKRKREEKCQLLIKGNKKKAPNLDSM